MQLLAPTMELYMYNLLGTNPLGWHTHNGVIATGPQIHSIPTYRPLAPFIPSRLLRWWILKS